MASVDKSTVAKARGHQTQWAAQFAVASELCKRGYEVAFTSGHTTPVADLMVVSPITKAMFLVDVKGLYRMNPWLIKRKPQRESVLRACLRACRRAESVLRDDAATNNAAYPE